MGKRGRDPGRGRGSGKGRGAAGAGPLGLGAALKPGPSSIRGFVDWPMDTIATVLEEDPHFGSALSRLLGTGAHLHSDYSGKLGPEVALRTIPKAFALRGTDVQHLVSQHRACDSDLTCQGLALQASACQTHGPKHVFGSLESRLPTAHGTAIQELLPPPKAPLAVRGAAYQRVELHLEENRQQCYCQNMMAPCMVHDNAEGAESTRSAGPTTWCGARRAPCAPHGRMRGSSLACKMP